MFGLHSQQSLLNVLLLVLLPTLYPHNLLNFRLILRTLNNQLLINLLGVNQALLQLLRSRFVLKHFIYQLLILPISPLRLLLNLIKFKRQELKLLISL